MARELQPKDIESVKMEFAAKNEYLSNLGKYGIVDVAPITQFEFFDYVFNRNWKGCQDLEPFEDADSEELRKWKEEDTRQAAAGIPKEKRKFDYQAMGYGCWRYNAVVFYIDNKGRNRHLTLYKDDWKKKDWLENRKFAIMAPMTYVGNTNSKSNGRYLYAFAIDLDGVGLDQLRNLFGQTHAFPGYGEGITPDERTPMPNLIVNSGHGFHLYYLLENPVPLYEKNVNMLNRMKEGLTNVIWNDGTSTLEDRQYQTIWQGFRLPETLTKFGEKITAWRIDTPLWTLDKLNQWLIGSIFAAKANELQDIDKQPKYNPTGVTLDKAAQEWPEWYARVIVNKERGGKKWNIKRDLYDWWLRRLKSDAEPVEVHHRYWCILTLVVYAIKCNIPREEAWADATSLVERMDRLTNDIQNPFTIKDVEDAFRAYEFSYRNWPRKTIVRTTGLNMPESVRNKLPQEYHLEDARDARDKKRKRAKKGEWDEQCGRNKENSTNSIHAELIKTWREQNIGNGNKSQCARDLGLSRPTINRWWDNKEESGKQKVLAWKAQHPGWKVEWIKDHTGNLFYKERYNWADTPAKELGISRRKVMLWWDDKSDDKRRVQEWKAKHPNWRENWLAEHPVTIDGNRNKVRDAWVDAPAKELKISKANIRLWWNDVKESEKAAWQKVKEWREAHPSSENKSKCARECGMTRPTVYRYWNDLESVEKNIEPEEATIQYRLTPEQFMEMLRNPAKAVEYRKKCEAEDNGKDKLQTKATNTL